MRSFICGEHLKREEEMNHGSQVKSGNLYLVCSQNKQVRKLAVSVKVHWSGFEHFAVVYRDKKYCNASAFIRMKNCVVVQEAGADNSKRFSITPNNSEGCRIVFECQSEREAYGWVVALQNRKRKSATKVSVVPEVLSVRSRSPMLPTVEESEEEV